VPGGGEILATNAANRSGIKIKSSIGSVLSPRNGATPAEIATMNFREFHFHALR
jgi:hypothetical protein